MKKTKEVILKTVKTYDYINNIKPILIEMEDIEYNLGCQKVDLEDGYVFCETIKLSFEETIIDFHFFVETLCKDIFLFRKTICMGVSLEGYITQTLKYIDYVPNNS